jgi:RNA polymerase sigma factor (sigma-70 family)
MDFNDTYLKAFHGDSAAEAELFRLMAVMFQMFIRRKNIGTEDTEDIVQNSLAKIAQSYRRGKAKANFAAWAQTVVKNELMDFYRARASNRRKLDELAVVVEMPPVEQPERGLRDKLRNCLRKLHESNPLHARILNLHYQGYTPSEVCEKLRLTPNNRRVALCRARAMLRACLNREERPNE